jgi:predicted phosphodiesterase
MGNHDGTKLFVKYFPYPYTSSYDWSFDDGPAHFVIIDQYYGGDENSPRWQWLREDLANSTKKWKFILLHEPGWSAGPHENNLEVQKIIHPIAVKYGVSIVFAGHNHYYSRAEVDGVTYITTGGAGAPLYDPEHGYPNIVVAIKEYHYLKIQISGNSLGMNVLTPRGDIIDELTINR